MATTKAKKDSKTAAPAATAIKQANDAALLGFNISTVVDCMKSMSASKAEADKAGETKAEAAHRLVEHAFEVAQENREAGNVDGDQLAQGWSRNIKALYASLASDGVSFIKVETKADGTIKHTLSGYGQNVNSVCRGFCQFDDISPDEDGSISADRAIVESRRALELDEDEQLLKAAKDELDEALKAYRKAATVGNDYELINAAATALLESAADMTAKVETADDIDEAIAAELVSETA